MQNRNRPNCWLAVAPLALVVSAAGGADWSVSQDGTGHYTLIQDAIDAAAGGDTVTVYAGTYTETIDPSGLAITVQANLDDYGSVIIDGEGTRQCVQCANEESDSTVFTGLVFENGSGVDGGGLYMEGPLAGPGATFTLCTFRNCTATDDGGAVYMDSGAPTFDTCTFENCVAASAGGAVASLDADATFIDCTFLECSAYDGGAANIGGGAPSFENCEFNTNTASWSSGALRSQSGSPSFSNCSFTGCMSEGFNVGAVQLLSGSDTITISNCVFSGNQAGSIGESSIGALSLNNVVLDMSGCTFDANIADGASAMSVSGESSIVLVAECQFDNHENGAINIQTGEVSFSSCSFSGNSNEGTGGGAVRISGHLLFTPPVVDFSSSTFLANSAAWGGAIYGSTSSALASATIALDNCTVEDGSATSKGAGLYLTDAVSAVTNCAISGNDVASESSTSGGGIYASGGTLDVSYTTFSDNTCSSNSGHAMRIVSDCAATLTSVSSCDHASDGEIYGDYTDDGGNDMGGWCCPGDVDDDGEVDSADLFSLITSFGVSDMDADDREDCSRDGDVDVEDLLGLLYQWGTCSGE